MSVGLSLLLLLLLLFLFPFSWALSTGYPSVCIFPIAVDDEDDDNRTLPKCERIHQSNNNNNNSFSLYRSYPYCLPQRSLTSNFLNDRIVRDRAFESSSLLLLCITHPCYARLRLQSAADQTEVHVCRYLWCECALVHEFSTGIVYHKLDSHPSYYTNGSVFKPVVNS